MVEQAGTPRNLPWFRFYTEFLGDPKVQSLDFGDQRHYVMLLCMKGAGLLDDAYPTPARRDAVIARALGLDRVASAEALRRLAESGLTNCDGQPLGWDGRQFKSDSATERVRRYRERLALAKAGRNVTVTAQDVEADVEESKSKAGPGELFHGGYVHNSVDNSAAAPPALSQATTAQNHPAPRTNGKAPSLPYSEAIARGVSSSRLVTERVLAKIVRATRHVCRERPDTPPAAVEDAVRQLVLALAQGMSVDVWAYLHKVIPEKAHKLVEDRIEAEARARRDELARDRGRPVIK